MYCKHILATVSVSSSAGLRSFTIGGVTFADLLNPSLRCGRYFATGSADALVSVWDANELACIKTFARLEWPVERNSIEK